MVIDPLDFVSDETSEPHLLTTLRSNVRRIIKIAITGASDLYLDDSNGVSYAAFRHNGSVAYESMFESTEYPTYGGTNQTSFDLTLSSCNSTDANSEFGSISGDASECQLEDWFESDDGDTYTYISGTAWNGNHWISNSATCIVGFVDKETVLTNIAITDLLLGVYVVGRVIKVVHNGIAIATHSSSENVMAVSIGRYGSIPLSSDWENANKLSIYVNYPSPGSDFYTDDLAITAKNIKRVFYYTGEIDVMGSPLGGIFGYAPKPPVSTYWQDYQRTAEATR